MLNAEPYISLSSVAAALDTLIYPSKTVAPNPLERLLLVDLFVSNPDLPQGEHIREFALHHILLDLITNEVIAKRALLNFPSPKVNESFEEAEHSVRTAGRTRNADLLLWTLLHYRYVRADLSINQDHMSRLISVNPRSLRRYYQYALRLLTRQLLREEWAVRVEHHRQHLYAALPRGVPLNLVGRGSLIEKALEELSTRMQSRIYITGAAGIGKSSFAEALVQRLIDAERLDKIFWLDAPPSCDFVSRFVANVLTQTNLSVRDYLQRHPTALVLDNADDLLRQPEKVSELLLEMSAAFVLLTSSAYAPLLEIDLHISLPDLDDESTVALVREQMRVHPNQLLEEDVAPWMLEQIGGNPRAVKIATAMLAYADSDDIRALAGEQTVGKAFDRMSQEARLCWCALSLLPCAPASELKTLWQDDIQPTALNELLQCFVAEQVDDKYCLTMSATNYVYQRVVVDEPIQALYRQLLGNLVAHAYRSVDVVERILLNQWGFIDERLQWMASYWRTGLEHGHFVQWYTILESAQADLTPDLSIAYGVCLRRSGNWEAARKIFQQAAHESGRRGDFHTQSSVLLELATLARLQGDYTEAAAILNQAQRCNAYGDSKLWQGILIERSQIALDRGDGAEALNLLRDAPETIHTSILSSEAFFVQGNFEDCRTTSLHALERSSADRRMEASLYTLIARSYDAQDECDSAWSYFALALTVLEQCEDISAIARAQSNLGAVLLKLGNVQQARELLDRAEPVLQMIDDTVGHHAALHNQRLINIYGVHFSQPANL